MPSNLLNVDSFVILVGGQLTFNKIVWMSIIDIRKVHVALCWLKLNNPLYYSIDSYTVEQLQSMLEERLERRCLQQQSDILPDEAILKQLTESAKSEMLEHFTVQAMDSESPADFINDFKLGTGKSNNFQLKKNERQ